MSAPQELKDELLRLLDEAYEVDGVSISRIDATASEFVAYDEGSTEGITQKQYKIVVDCTDSESIKIRIRPVTPPLAWPF